MSNKSGLKNNILPDKFYINFRGKYKLIPIKINNNFILNCIIKR